MAVETFLIKTVHSYHFIQTRVKFFNISTNQQTLISSHLLQASAPEEQKFLSFHLFMKKNANYEMVD